MSEIQIPVENTDLVVDIDGEGILGEVVATPKKRRSKKTEQEEVNQNA